MTTIVGKIPDGKYTIRNVETNGYANLTDGKNGHPITSGQDGSASDVQWKVKVKVSSKNYKITSCAYEDQKATYPASDEGETVVANSNDSDAEWIIKETSTPGNYLISPAANSDLFWKLANGNSDTPVNLSKDTTDNTKWSFKKISS